MIDFSNIFSTKANPYLALTDPDKSVFGVYALPVTFKEYVNIDKYLSDTVNTKKVSYDTLKNIIIGANTIGGNIAKILQHSGESISSMKTKTSFVCSSFVSTVIHELTSTGKVMDKLKMNYAMLTPNGCKNIPGLIKLFEGTFSNYNIELTKFLKSNTNFNKYV